MTAQRKIIECYAVVDDGELRYESIDDTAMDAVRAATWGDEDANDVNARMMSGQIKVHRLRIEIGAVVEAIKDATKPKKK